MANLWKYASVPQRERLSMIRGGNTDVYNAEKRRNNSLKILRESLGLSTQNVDDWNKTVDNAYSLSQEKTQDKSGLPKFTGGKYARINKALSESVNNLRQQRDEGIKDVTADAESTLGYIGEWLANNGYSEKGYLATASKKEINDALEAAIESIIKDYEDGIQSTRSKYRSMVM